MELWKEVMKRSLNYARPCRRSAKTIFISHGRHGCLQGCSHVAASCKKWMPETVAEEMGFDTLPSAEQTEFWKEVMKTSYMVVDVISILSCSGGTTSYRCELQTQKCNNVGSTAVVTVVRLEVIVVANAGDSRAVLCRNGEVVPLSEDQKSSRRAATD